MNFLAHIFLSGNNEPTIIGNFIGDFVKGKDLDQYDEAIRKGILLHRFIDHYTDNHSVVLESKKRLRSKYHHYSPVIIDLYYDHFLARKWDIFSDIPLKSFTRDFYDLTNVYLDIIPQKARHMLTYMKRDDWLYNYQFLDGINRALTGLSRRTTFNSKMEKAVVDLENNYTIFEKEFLSFFPDLQFQSTAFISSKT